MPVWESVAGIEHTTARSSRTLVLLTSLALCILAGAMVLFQSCSTFSSSQASSPSSPSQNQEANEEDEEEEEDESSQDLTANLPRPATPSAWHTRVFVTTMPQPTAKAMANCHEQIHSLAEEAGNQEAMLQAKSRVAQLVANDPTLYHYCFFDLMMRLDERLDRGGKIMDDLATAFFDGMRRLWILALALDAQNGRDRYFSWLQKRYIELSSSHFGRQIEVVSSPMNRLQGGPVVTGGSGAVMPVTPPSKPPASSGSPAGKPAGSFQNP